uniref:Uncharacterized protein MANES_05G115200 n=1 Tax=Rhizophora mucronata TaxID=61149 RepID=A0A2P2LT15_RHIMU
MPRCIMSTTYSKKDLLFIILTAPVSYRSTPSNPESFPDQQSNDLSSILPLPILFCATNFNEHGRFTGHWSMMGGLQSNLKFRK